MPNARTNIPVTHATDNLLINTTYCFIQHQHHTPFSNLRCGESPLPLCANERVNGRIDLFFAFTPFLTIKIETPTIFSAFAIVVQN